MKQNKLLKTQSKTFIETNPKIRLPLEIQKEILSDYSSSDYSSNSWRLDLRNIDRSPTLTETVHFDRFANYPKILQELKEWVVLILTRGYAPTTIKEMLRPFGEIIDKGILKKDSFFEITQEELLEYYKTVFPDAVEGTSISKWCRWTSLKQFYFIMGKEEILSWINKFPLPKLLFKPYHEDKLIGQEIIEKLDRIFYYEPLPTVDRLVYWILRLIPNRIEEVISIPFDCLEYKGDLLYCLKIPTFKQAGRYAQAQWREIYIINDGLGAFLIELIQTHQEYLKKNNVNTGFLITEQNWQCRNNKWIKMKNTEFRIFSRNRFNEFLKRIIKLYDIRDLNGKLVKVTTHMFRHNAISERVNSKLFSLLDISYLTGHLTTTMIEIAYLHSNMPETKKTLLEFDKTGDARFPGRLLPQADNNFFDKLATRLTAKKIPGLGVCRDVRSCSLPVSQCYECPYFRPKQTDPDFFKNELEDWKRKKALAVKTQDFDFIQQCDKNIKILETGVIKNER